MDRHANLFTNMGMTWEEICADPILADLPYKIESDRWGNVIMSPPAGANHCDYQGEILAALLRLKPGGRARAEYPLRTNQGVKAIDVAWVSKERHGQRPEKSIVHLLAPEICVEVFSASNSVPEIEEKTLLYFERGAQERWTCDEAGSMSFFDPSGSIKRFRLCPKFPVRIKRV